MYFGAPSTVAKTLTITANTTLSGDPLTVNNLTDGSQSPHFAWLRLGLNYIQMSKADGTLGNIYYFNGVGGNVVVEHGNAVFVQELQVKGHIRQGALLGGICEYNNTFGSFIWYKDAAATPNRLMYLTSTEFGVDCPIAVKEGGGSWSAASDERIKSNIRDANVDACWNAVKALPLKIFDIHAPRDKLRINTLGWIAQEVKHIFPDSVTLKNDNGFDDFHYLDVDQLYKNMYGALHKAINCIESHQTTIQSLQDTVQTQQNTIQSLESRLAAIEARLAAAGIA